MTERKQLASNIVRCHTSLDPDQARLHIRKPGTNPAASKLLSQNDRPLPIQARQWGPQFRDQPQNLLEFARGNGDPGHLGRQWCGRG